jgi:hypothetical protein
MRAAALCLLLLTTAGQLLGQPAKRSTQKSTRYRDCDTLCADLNAAIQRHPGRLGMWLEDALVIHESCAAEIVAAAIDAVDNQPELVRAILETAVHVAPRREQQIRLAARRFKIPAAAEWLEPKPQEVVEVRRALAADKTEPTPLEEVRRAVVPVTASASPPRADRK